VPDRGDRTSSFLRQIPAAAGIFLSLGAVAAALTLLWLGMRSVMDIGGFCAEGGPYTIQTHCPKGVTAVMFGSIWGGMIGAGIYVWQTSKHRVPSLVWLFWPALFLSLGWNFLQYGIHPLGGGGLVWGWLICAIVFILMGGIPLAVVLPFMARRFMQGDGDTTGAPQSMSVLTPEVVRTAAGAFSALRKLRRSGVLEEALAGAVIGEPASPPQGGPTSDDIVSRLERLDALHRSGAIDDAEFEAAKHTLLQEEGRP
jgi:hypothetical protein